MVGVCVGGGGGGGGKDSRIGPCMAQRVNSRLQGNLRAGRLAPCRLFFF